MKTTLDLLNKVVAMGFDREKALADIDASLDDIFGAENRLDLDAEFISNKLYNNILLGFVCEREAREGLI